MVIISVLDVNDNILFFYLIVYEVNIWEDVKLGEKLIQVIVDDIDLGINVEIEYFLSEFDGIFVLDSYNGNLYLVKFVDYEIRKVYSFKVIVTDKGDLRLLLEVDLNVRIIDVNDNFLEFINDFFVLFILESIERFSSIGQILVNDKDSGLYGQVEYYIVSQDFLGKNFYIDKNIGRFRLEILVDREEVVFYMLNIVVIDLVFNVSLRLILEKIFLI